MAAEFAQHLGAVAVGLGEVHVAFERVVEGGERILHLAEPVQRLADHVMRARLAAVEAERTAGKIDALLVLAFLAGDDGDVIERVGVLRVDAQHLGVSLHGERDLPLAVVEQALLEKLLGGRGLAHGRVLSRLGRDAKGRTRAAAWFETRRYHGAPHHEAGLVVWLLQANSAHYGRDRQGPKRPSRRFSNGSNSGGPRPGSAAAKSASRPSTSAASLPRASASNSCSTRAHSRSSTCSSSTAPPNSAWRSRKSPATAWSPVGAPSTAASSICSPRTSPYSAEASARRMRRRS